LPACRRKSSGNGRHRPFQIADRNHSGEELL
jgi:hypothetical protein